MERPIQSYAGASRTKPSRVQAPATLNCAHSMLMLMLLSFTMKILLLIIAAVSQVSTDVPASVCDTQCTGSIAGTETANFCQSGPDLQLKNRCCFNKTAGSTIDTVVGIDLHNCNLSSITGLFKGMPSLAVISLQDNDLVSLTMQDFYGLPNLNYLTVSSPNSSIQCPGGNEAWMNVSYENYVLTCQSQLDTCFTSENNETCPSPNSYCKITGPGLVDCLCSPDYHGYKCLRKGEFPVATFVGTLGGSTVFLSVFLWFLQRRNVKTKKTT